MANYRNKTNGCCNSKRPPVAASLQCHAGFPFLRFLFCVLCVWDASPLRLNSAVLASWYDAAGYTCAAWGYPLGTRLKVTEIHNHLSVIVTVTDRGPARRLFRQERRIDLSRAAFEQLDGLELGLAEVSISVYQRKLAVKNSPLPPVKK